MTASPPTRATNLADRLFPATIAPSVGTDKRLASLRSSSGSRQVQIFFLTSPLKKSRLQRGTGGGKGGVPQRHKGPCGRRSERSTRRSPAATGALGLPVAVRMQLEPAAVGVGGEEEARWRQALDGEGDLPLPVGRVVLLERHLGISIPERVSSLQAAASLPSRALPVLCCRAAAFPLPLSRSTRHTSPLAATSLVSSSRGPSLPGGTCC